MLPLAQLPLCKKKKEELETQKNETRQKLDDYLENVFPVYENYINTYLERFGADYRLINIQSRRSKGSTSFEYQLQINSNSVPLSSDQGPSFKTTLGRVNTKVIYLQPFSAT